MRILTLFLLSLFINQISAQEIKGTQVGEYIYSKPFKISKKEVKYIYDDVYFEFLPNETPKQELFERTIKNPKEYFLAKMINLNNSKIFDNNCGDLTIIQEAKDSLNRWKPIEYHINAMCGNCYDNPLYLKKFEYVFIPIKKYSGDYKTELRLKLRNRNSVYYSNSFESYINYSQFKEHIEYSRGLKSDSYLEDNPFRE